MSTQSWGRCAVFEEPGGASAVQLRERPEPEIPAGHVVVRMKSAALNHLDVFTVEGLQRIEPPRVLAADGAGIVDRGSGRWREGDEVVLYPVSCDWDCDACRAGQQVFCPHFGIFGEHVDGTACQLFAVPEQNVFPKPRGLDWTQSAAFPLTFLTAWRMLVTRARLQRGETVLVVGAGAGVACAAIAIASHLGARVLATSRSETKRSRAVALGAEAAFDTSSFSRAVRGATGSRGVDVVFEHVGAATLDESLKSLAPGGRVVFCGSTSGPTAELNMPRVFFRQADLLGSTMGNASDFESVLQAVDAGLRPVVDTTFPLAEVGAALTHLESGEQFGKVVLEID